MNQKERFTGGFHARRWHSQEGCPAFIVSMKEAVVMLPSVSFVTGGSSQLAEHVTKQRESAISRLAEGAVQFRTFFSARRRRRWRLQSIPQIGVLAVDEGLNVTADRLLEVEPGLPGDHVDRREERVDDLPLRANAALTVVFAVDFAVR
jgi:hypothetical protein